MIETSVAQTIQERQLLASRLVQAFLRGADEEMIEVRGYGLTQTERAETEHDAIEIYAS